MIKTRLTELLRVEHPVMLAGMGGVSYHRLVAAVSEAGGFGCLGASTMSPEQMVEEMAAVRAATTKPFGVDLLTAMPGDLVGQVERIIEGGASVFVAGLGVPTKVVDLCHAHGLLVVNMCGKVEHARRAVDAGC
ncbi:NAD(P)H-dependent flavin oxidoreductase, partial [Aciditerrimonas ferrireducens]